MAENAAAPLAQFLIDKNRELEAEVHELQESAESVDKLETSLRYTRCLLTNYAEMHKDASVALDDIKSRTFTIRLKLILGFAVIVLPFILHSGGITGRDNKPLIWTLGLGVVSAVGWIVYDINAELNTIKHTIQRHVHEVEHVQRSNHLFPDIVENLPRADSDE